MKRITHLLILSLFATSAFAQKSDFKELELNDLTLKVNVLNKQEFLNTKEQAPASEKMQARLELARALFAADRFDAAEEMYMKVIDGPYTHTQDYLNFAMALMSNGKYDLAKEVYLIANEKDPLGHNAQLLWEQVFAQLSDKNFSEDRKTIFEGRTMYGSSSIGSNYLMHVNNAFKEINLGCLHEIAVEHEVRVNNSEEGERNTIAYMSGPDMIIFSQRDESGKYSLYQAFRKNGDWRRVKRLPLPKKANFLFPYGSENELYFSSDMDGSIGGFDIYRMSYIDGEWSEPVNMGESINTPKNELFPSLQNGMLHFVSNGLPTFGGYDNYYLDFRYDRIVHLENPYNTKGNDYGVINYIPGRSAYVLTKGNNGFMLEFVQKHEFETKIVRGVVTGKDNKPVTNARVTLMETNSREGQVFLTDADGEFVFVLPTEMENIEIDVAHPDYATLSQGLSLDMDLMDHQVELVLGSKKRNKDNGAILVTNSSATNSRVSSAKPTRVQDIARTVSTTSASATAGNYYVIIGSTTSLQSAREFVAAWKATYPKVEILSYENRNIYRIGIDAGTKKSNAVEDLQEVRRKVEDAWLLSPSVQ